MGDQPPEWIQDHYDGDVPSIPEDPGGPIALDGIDPAPGMSEAVERAVGELAEHLEYELRGAWRAGYDYLHVYDEPPGQTWGSDDFAEAFTLRQYVYPANDGVPRPDPDDLIYRHSYDLTSVPDDVMRAAVRGDLGD